METAKRSETSRNSDEESVVYGFTPQINCMSYQCQKCQTEIAWLRHKETGKPAPIEVNPSQNGNILVKNGQYRIATPEEVEKARQINKPLFLNHFASCEFAKSFKKPCAKKHQK